MTDIRPGRPEDAADVARIYNQGIEDRTATFETELQRPEKFKTLLANPDSPPLLVAVEDGKVVGWAGLTSYSERECYSGVAEAAMYVDREARGRHIGMRLGEALGAEAARRGYWKIVGLLFADNPAGRGIAEASGARVVGTFRNHAQLEGEWRDVVVVEVLLKQA